MPDKGNDSVITRYTSAKYPVDVITKLDLLIMSSLKKISLSKIDRGIKNIFNTIRSF